MKLAPFKNLSCVSFSEIPSGQIPSLGSPLLPTYIVLGCPCFPHAFSHLVACQHYLQEVLLLHSANTAFKQHQVWCIADLLRKCCRAWDLGSMPDLAVWVWDRCQCCGACVAVLPGARQAMRAWARHPAVDISCRELGLGHVWEAAVLELGSFPQRCSSRMQFTMAESKGWLKTDFS